jgi:hypothetical protein
MVAGLAGLKLQSRLLCAVKKQRRTSAVDAVRVKGDSDCARHPGHPSSIRVGVDADSLASLARNCERRPVHKLGRGNALYEIYGACATPARTVANERPRALRVALATGVAARGNAERRGQGGTSLTRANRALMKCGAMRA